MIDGHLRTRAVESRLSDSNEPAPLRAIYNPTLCRFNPSIDSSSPLSMQNEGTGTLARLRAEEHRVQILEREADVLRLKNARNLEEIETAEADCRLYKARCERTDIELAQLQSRYDALKREVAFKRTRGPYVYGASLLRDHFADLPPELILLLPPLLPRTASLNALALTCRRLHDILQPELESRLTPALARRLLLWAAESKPHIVAKLLSPPHCVRPGEECEFGTETPLHIAAQAGNVESARLLLEAGANPMAQWDRAGYQPLHLAAQNNHLEVVKLLLDCGAPIDRMFGWHNSQSALHSACAGGQLEVVKFLVERGAQIERYGAVGSALSCAVRGRKLDVVRFLLRKGADVTATVKLFDYPEGQSGHIYPDTADLLYCALDLRHPIGSYPWDTPWQGLPLGEEQRQLMALLLVHGASKDVTMETVERYLGELARQALYTEAEFLDVIAGMLKEAEDAIPQVLRDS
ncbi:ankyrin repeat-containing domain protein [Mycena polygramma]|nr:ankyrin repeat-containing domain protein [Mycena polygramma]